MKSIRLAVFLIIATLLASSCSNSKEEELKAPAQPEEIAQSISSTLCKKVTQCRPGTDAQEPQCITQTKASLLNLLQAQPLLFTKGELKTCLDSIAVGNCEAIMNPDGPPQGCEKLQ